MIENFTVETFTPFLGDIFRISSDSLPLDDLVLISATEVGRPYNYAADSPTRTPFSIMFRGSGETVLPQHIYRMEHDKLGAFEIFIVPIGADREGMRYEAIFT